MGIFQNLSTAVKNNDTHGVRQLLNTVEQYWADILSKCPDPGMAEMLIKNGVNPNWKNSKGNTPLGDMRNIDVARTLVMNGADFNAVGANNMTVLNKAASRKDSAKVFFLIQQGATKWNDCAKGHKFFKDLFANFLLLSGMLRTFVRLN
jgi:hypothetical protein